MARKPVKAAADPASLESLARAALLEVNPAEHIGPFVEARPGSDAGLTDVVFEPTQRGYVGWSWIVTIATVQDAETGEALPPTVLELGLLPGEDALLAPEWVPWSVRLADWEAQQAILAAEAGEAIDEDADDELDDDEDSDEDSDDDESDEDDDDSDDEDLDDEFDDDDEDDDLDPDDEDEDAPRSTHGGDIDGVDIDDFDDTDED